MTYAAKLKASRQKAASLTSNAPQQPSHDPSSTAHTAISHATKVQSVRHMPSSISHGSMDTGGPNAQLDHNRSRNGGVQKATNAPQRRRSAHRMSIRMPTTTAGMRVVKDNYFVQALSHTTYAFCRETTLHGMKYVVQDIEELGSTYSR